MNAKYKYTTQSKYQIKPLRKLLGNNSENLAKVKVVGSEQEN